MIKSHQQAVEVQKRRYEQGKTRIAKAVRRFLKKNRTNEAVYADCRQFMVVAE